MPACGRSEILPKSTGTTDSECDLTGSSINYAVTCKNNLMIDRLFTVVAPEGETIIVDAELDVAANELIVVNNSASIALPIQ